MRVQASLFFIILATSFAGHTKKSLDDKMEGLGRTAPVLSTISPIVFVSGTSVAGVSSLSTTTGLLTFGAVVSGVNVNGGSVVGINVHDFIEEMESECKGGFGRGFLGAIKCFFSKPRNENDMQKIKKPKKTSDEIAINAEIEIPDPKLEEEKKD
jgi:hypothetical protein